MSLFSDPIQKQILHYLERYETKRSAILPILHVIQDELGWIQKEHVEALEKEYGLSRVEVWEVATFYSMYRLKACKPLRIYYCDNVVCSIMGGKKTTQKIEEELKQRFPDQEHCPFSLEPVPCLGVCDGAPALLVNKDRHLKITENQVAGLLDHYKNGSTL